MDKSTTDWLAANDHTKDSVPRTRQAWTRTRGETWFRPRAGTIGVKGEASSPEHRLVTASRVAGVKVRSTGGQPLGKVAEIAIDEATGEVAFVVVASGGFLGFGERRVRVPWAALSYRAERADYVLAMPDAEVAHLAASAERIAFQPATDRGGWATSA